MDMEKSIFSKIENVLMVSHCEAEEAEGYQAISDKETTDLRALMSGCDTAVIAADEFADRLAKELSVLGGDNIHSMMASEVRSSWHGGLECYK